jgi:predicted negative regulator of RcsB-dependent stress response
MSKSKRVKRWWRENGAVIAFILSILLIAAIFMYILRMK